MSEALLRRASPFKIPRLNHIASEHVLVIMRACAHSATIYIRFYLLNIYLLGIIYIIQRVFSHGDDTPSAIAAVQCVKIKTFYSVSCLHGL